MARLLLLPVMPRYWRIAARTGIGWILLQLVLGVLISDALVARRYADRLENWLYDAASSYEQQGDRLVFEQGQFRLDEGHPLQWVSGDFTFLIDPDSTIPDDAIDTASYLTVRADKILLHRPSQTREFSAEQLVPLLGDEPVRLDADWVRRVGSDLLRTVTYALYAPAAVFGDLVGCLIYACVAGGLLLARWGRALGLDFAACFRVALATSALTVVLDFVLTLADASVGLIGVLLWPALMTALGWFALRSESDPVGGDTDSASLA